MPSSTKLLDDAFGRINEKLTLIVCEHAEVFVTLGALDEAAAQLADVLSAPSWMTPGLIDTDPLCAPLRDHPTLRQYMETRSTVS